MSSAPSSFSSRFFYICFSSAAMFLIVVCTAGCGAGPSPESGPKFSGKTSVNLLLSSTADDQFVRFDIELQSLLLKNQSGATVEMLSASQGVEFIHVNGGIEPLLTVSIPQGIYTGATATIGTADFTCVTLTPSGSLDTSIFAYGQTPADHVTVSLPSPITVTGSNMSLSLTMLVPQSAALSSCYDPHGQYTYSITPTFEVEPISLQSHPTNAKNGKVHSLDGEIASIDSGSNKFQLSLPQDLLIEPSTVSITSGNGTLYEGISGLSGLEAGMLIDTDGAVQPDGSVTASRIAVLDANTSNLSVQTGPVIQTNSSVPLVWAFGQRQQGYFYDTGQAAIWIPYDYSSATFQISGGFTNLLSLPFVATFNASNMVDGQNVYVTSHATRVTGNPYTPATTITLFPQTINGTISGSSLSGGFTVYTVSLAPYSLFPQLAVQPGQAVLLSNPSQVEVYVDSNTQKINTIPLAPGSTLRFRGLVFNDNGTLRMDCAQISDGISVSSSSNSTAPLERGEVRIIAGEGLAGKAITTTIQSHPAQK